MFQCLVIVFQGLCLFQGLCVFQCMIVCVSGPQLAVFQDLSRRHAVHARSDAGRTSVTVAPAPKLFIALFILLERGGGRGGGVNFSFLCVYLCEWEK